MHKQMEDEDASIIGHYINLDSRDDRRKHFEEKVKCHPIFSKIERMSAIPRKDVKGVGCTLSHIECMRMLKEKGKDNPQKYYMIFEDDFLILNMENFQSFVKSFKMIKDLDVWDVIVLTPSGYKENNGNDVIMQKNFFSKIIRNQTATAYIFKSHMIDVFIENFADAYTNMMETKKYALYGLDQYWKRLQLKYNFYYYTKLFAGQLPGWSDLENKHVNYTDAFLSGIK
jgi:hypothetical protein